MTLNMCLKLAEQLSHDELAQLGMAVNALKLGAPSRPAVSADGKVVTASPVLRILGALCEALRERDIASPARSTMQAKASEPSFIQKAVKLDAFIKRQSHDVATKRALLLLGIDLLLDQLAQENFAPLSFSYAANNLHRITALFDHSFPGYGNAGLLGIVVSTKEVSKRFVKQRHAEIIDEVRKQR